jgi:hypothetical protein
MAIRKKINKADAVIFNPASFHVGRVPANFTYTFRSDVNGTCARAGQQLCSGHFRHGTTLVSGASHFFGTVRNLTSSGLVATSFSRRGSQLRPSEIALKAVQYKLTAPMPGKLEWKLRPCVSSLSALRLT